MSGRRRWQVLALAALGCLSGCGVRSTGPAAELDRFVAGYLIEQATPSGPIEMPDGRWSRRVRLVRGPNWGLLPASKNGAPRARLTFSFDVRYTQPVETREAAAADGDFRLTAPLGGSYGIQRREIEFEYREGKWGRAAADCGGV